MVKITAALFALALTAAPAVLASPNEARNLAKRERALSFLHPSVRSWVEQIEDRHVTFDDVDEEDEQLQRRQSGAPRTSDGSIGNCIDTRQAVTFDDGPYTNHLNLANQWNADGHKITYFVNGQNWACGYNTPFVGYMRKSVAAGNQLAYHSWSHPHFASATIEQLDHQVALLQNMTLKTVGVSPKYWRWPYGETRKDLVSHLKNKYNIDSVYWSDDTRDAAGGSVKDSIALYQKLDTSKPHIILNHEVKEPTYTKVSPKAIQALNSKGKKSRTVHTCVGGSGSAYHVQIAPQARDSTWTCEGTTAPGDLE